VASLIVEEESVPIKREIRNFLASLPIMMLARRSSVIHRLLAEQQASVSAAVFESSARGIYLRSTGRFQLSLAKNVGHLVVCHG